jgi:hypothetical protein
MSMLLGLWSELNDHIKVLAHVNVVRLVVRSQRPYQGSMPMSMLLGLWSEVNDHIKVLAHVNVVRLLVRTQRPYQGSSPCQC